MEIKNKYEHSKCGMFMFNLCAKWTKFILKHRWLYYILACTWGILMTVLGLIITLVCAIWKIFDRTIEFNKYNWVYSVKIGPQWWGGCDMGLMFLRDRKSSSQYLDTHEFGHTFQNCLFGPLFPFIVAIPSASRYWIQSFRSAKGLKNKPYDGIWFEDAASQCGDYANKYLNKEVD